VKKLPITPPQLALASTCCTPQSRSTRGVYSTWQQQQHTSNCHVRYKHALEHALHQKGMNDKKLRVMCSHSTPACIQPGYVMMSRHHAPPRFSPLKYVMQHAAGSAPAGEPGMQACCPPCLCDAHVTQLNSIFPNSCRKPKQQLCV
jgi:hypothetical protein